MVDRWMIFASAGLRAMAVGMSGVILAMYLVTLGLDAQAIGLSISLGLAGCALGTFTVTLVADHLGRRATLVLLAGFMVLGGVTMALAASATVVMVGALVGMVNGMGRDRGPGLTVEQAMLPQTTTESQRTAVFAWYNLVVDAGHAVGSLLGGLPAILRAHAGLQPLASYQWTWGLYGALCLVAGLLVFRLSRSVELRGPAPTRRLSPTSRPVVAKFAALSALDSFGGGFLTTALVSF